MGTPLPHFTDCVCSLPSPYFSNTLMDLVYSSVVKRAHRPIFTSGLNIGGKSIAYTTIRMLKRELFGIVWVPGLFNGPAGLNKNPCQETEFSSGILKSGRFRPCVGTTPYFQSRCAIGLWKRHPVSGSVSGKKYICLRFFGVVWVLGRFQRENEKGPCWAYFSTRNGVCRGRDSNPEAFYRRGILSPLW